MTVADQLVLFRTLANDSTADPRWDDTSGVALLNQARRKMCELTKCFQIKDTQQTSKGVAAYSLQKDVIRVLAVEYNGIVLDPIQPENWRNNIGYDDTLQGQPAVYREWNRQIQLFYVPGEAKTLEIVGWGYCAALTVNGNDVEFTDQQAQVAIYGAAAEARALDGIDAEYVLAQWNEGIAKYTDMYRKKGPRMVRELTVYRGFLPVRNMQGT